MPPAFRRRHNLSRIRQKITYTTEEAALSLGVHENTVRQWLKGGLKPIDQAKPLLIHGHALCAFLKARQAKQKQTCAPDQLFCLKCRKPTGAMGGMVDVVFVSPKIAQIKALCEVCGTTTNRREAVSKLPQTLKAFEQVTLLYTHIMGCVPPSLNCYFSQGEKDHEN